MGRIYTGLVLAALWGAGCGDTTEPVATEPIERHVDGSRLKARVLSTSDGLRWFKQLYDSQFQTPCTWQKAAPDGAYYCVASDTGNITDAEDSRLQGYTDANCSIPLAYFSPPPGPNTLISKTDGTCDGLQRFHTVGEAWSESYFQRDYNGDCVREVRDAAYLYRVGPEVAASDYLVRGVLQEKQSGRGIKAYTIKGEDGSESFQSLQDTTRDTECTVRLARDGTLRCLPSGESTGASASASVDPACTEPAFATTSYLFCTAPRFAVYANPEETCPSGLHVVAVGEEVSQVYGSLGENNPGCQPRPPQPRYVRYYRAGAELPARNWVEAKEVDLKTHGRLTVRGVELGGAVKVPTQIVDTQLETRCTFRSDPAGTLRCYPSQHLINLEPGYFADAACTTPVSHVYPASCTVGAYAVYIDESQGFPGKNRAFHLGPRHEGPAYGRNLAGQCLTWSLTPPEPLYVVGAELDVMSLVQGTDSME
ncbi:hypothetical protein HUA74_19685 [Myxococcus sp. CA051A]|uniref:DUF7481 family protein n=1 Tax=Myxococcus sp. CA051A TaxID=2741739 RepID=UPI00157B9417|nr:hypothetical protein [Myxococcus sp. CA051A]NTX62873.1 hypothetical protein [Myxococcus sp. CA051A]